MPIVLQGCGASSVKTCWEPPVFEVGFFLSFIFFPPCPASTLECTPGLGPDPGLDLSAQPGLIEWTEITEWVVKRKCCGWTDSQTDQWDQGSWLRCCWDGRRCVFRWSMWLAVKLGMDHIKLADSLALWTRERCNEFDAVARRHWEGRDDNLCVCACVCVAVFGWTSKENQPTNRMQLSTDFSPCYTGEACLSRFLQKSTLCLVLHATLINICSCKV